MAFIVSDAREETANAAVTRPELKAELAEFKTDFAKMRTEFAEVKSEIAQLRTDLNAQILLLK